MHFLCVGHCDCNLLCVDVVTVRWSTKLWLGFAGQILWRRLPIFPIPSHHTVRGACMQLLPLVEMFCKWELQEDCIYLHALMLRFDSEEDLESHELGRSLLFMVRDEDGDLNGLPALHTIERAANPFEVVRERLAAVTLAIGDLRPHVHSVFDYIVKCRPIGKFDFTNTFIQTRHSTCAVTLNYSAIRVHVLQKTRNPLIEFGFVHILSLYQMCLNAPRAARMLFELLLHVCGHSRHIPSVWSAWPCL